MSGRATRSKSKPKASQKETRKKERDYRIAMHVSTSTVKRTELKWKIVEFPFVTDKVFKMRTKLSDVLDYIREVVESDERFVRMFPDHREFDENTNIVVFQKRQKDYGGEATLKKKLKERRPVQIRDVHGLEEDSVKIWKNFADKSLRSELVGEEKISILDIGITLLRPDMTGKRKAPPNAIVCKTSSSTASERKKAKIHNPSPPDMLKINIMQPVFIDEKVQLTCTKTTRVLKQITMDFNEFCKFEESDLPDNDEEEDSIFKNDTEVKYVYPSHGVLTVLRKRIANAILADDDCKRAYHGLLGKHVSLKIHIVILFHQYCKSSQI